MFDFGYTPDPDTEAQYFLSHQPLVQIPVSDITAYQLYDQYRWMFNKIVLSEVQNIWAYPDRYPPESFPVIHKPIINLYGMSAGVTTINNNQQYQAIFKPGYMVMPVLYGTQYSTDVALVEGQVVWTYTFLAHKNEHNTFLLWEKQLLPQQIYDSIISWIEQHFTTFTGIVNLETIDNKLIECQPRLSAQYVDLYGGDQWLYSVIELYQHNKWTFIDDTPETAFSIPLRMVKDQPFCFRRSIVDQAKRHCSSIQLFSGSDVEVHVDDEYSKRVAVVNCFDLEEGRKAIQILKDGIITNNRSITWI